MADRFSQGTFDHDGDGKPGGSLSLAEAKRRAAEKDLTMAKQPQTAKNADKPAPSQPWAKPAAETEKTAPVTSGEGATEGEDEAAKEAAAAAAAEAAEAAALARRDKIQAQLEALDEDDRATFEAFMAEQAEKKLDQLTKGREAREMEVRLVNPAEHYGNRIPRPQPVEDEG